MFRTSSRWSQFVTLAMAQLAGRKSLRDTVEKVSAQRTASIIWAMQN
ncbi:MAG: DUF4372 domain-containing protein [Saprospiraceae bacterium]|nr:DUF4372 domain-containing protein [Candidatus Brachybacter algidus]